MPKVNPIPPGHHALTPYLIVDDAAGAIAFYTRAFGAQEIYRMPGPDGRIMHAEIVIPDSPLMLTDADPARCAASPRTLKGSPVSVFLYTPDVDQVFARAVEAGAQATMPPTDMFWGDRFAALTDPFGHSWQLATHVEDVAPEEMAKRASAATA